MLKKHVNFLKVCIVFYRWPDYKFMYENDYENFYMLFNFKGIIIWSKLAKRVDEMRKMPQGILDRNINLSLKWKYCRNLSKMKSTLGKIWKNDNFK